MICVHFHASGKLRGFSAGCLEPLNDWKKIPDPYGIYHGTNFAILGFRNISVENITTVQQETVARINKDFDVNRYLMDFHSFQAIWIVADIRETIFPSRWESTFCLISLHQDFITPWEYRKARRNKEMYHFQIPEGPFVLHELSPFQDQPHNMVFHILSSGIPETVVASISEHEHWQSTKPQLQHDWSCWKRAESCLVAFLYPPLTSIIKCYLIQDPQSTMWQSPETKTLQLALGLHKSMIQIITEEENQKEVFQTPAVPSLHLVIPWTFS